ncbi:MAG: MotA/TolQ/ExbB proton channel family protein [bacterium]
MKPNNRSLLNKRGLLASLFCILVLMIFLSTTAQSVGKNKGASNSGLRKAAQTVPTENVEEESGQQEMTVWDIIQMTDWLFWPFVLISTVGVLLIVFRSLLEYQEKTRAQNLLNQLVHVRDMRSLQRAVHQSPKNRASRLFKQIISTFNKTGRAEPIREEANQILNAERDSFETFNRVLGFLSDTAGALGLLGTVWGIFATFHGGKLDGPTILRGMSISLVTTLVGLIISLILNFGVTTVFAMFNRHISLLSSRAEEVRQALLNLEKNTQRRHVESARRRRSPEEVVRVHEYEMADDDNGTIL